MAKVDFKNLRVQATIEGDPIIVDTRKELGNLVWGAARDIAVSDFGKEIYFSDGPTEVGEETAVDPRHVQRLRAPETRADRGADAQETSG